MILASSNYWWHPGTYFPGARAYAPPAEGYDPPPMGAEYWGAWAYPPDWGYEEEPMKPDLKEQRLVRRCPFSSRKGLMCNDQQNCVHFRHTNSTYVPYSQKILSNKKINHCGEVSGISESEPLTVHHRKEALLHRPMEQGKSSISILLLRCKQGRRREEQRERRDERTWLRK